MNKLFEMDVNPTSTVITKRAARKLIAGALLNVSELQTALGKKEFKRRLKKVSKILSEGFPTNKSKKNQKVKGKKVESPAA